MNKRRFFILLTAALLAAALVFGSCGEKNAKKPDPAIPERITVEQSENSFGARFIYTLGGISALIADDLDSDYPKLSQTDWETISAGLVDDNDISYSSYRNSRGEITFTAAVEDESGKVMNIGCGCASKRLEDMDFYDSFVYLSAIIAKNAGGYQKKDMDFLIQLITDLLAGNDDILCYNGSLYIRSVYEGTTVLMVAPCSDKIISENNYKQYQ